MWYLKKFCQILVLSCYGGYGSLLQKLPVFLFKIKYRCAGAGSPAYPVPFAEVLVTPGGTWRPHTWKIHAKNESILKERNCQNSNFPALFLALCQTAQARTWEKCIMPCPWSPLGKPNSLMASCGEWKQKKIGPKLRPLFTNKTRKIQISRHFFCPNPDRLGRFRR